MLEIGDIDVEFDFLRSEKITEKIAKDLGLIVDESEQSKNQSKYTIKCSLSTLFLLLVFEYY